MNRSASTQATIFSGRGSHGCRSNHSGRAGYALSPSKVWRLSTSIRKKGYRQICLFPYQKVNNKTGGGLYREERGGKGRDLVPPLFFVHSGGNQRLHELSSPGLRGPHCGLQVLGRVVSRFLAAMWPFESPRLPGDTWLGLVENRVARCRPLN